MLYTDSPGGSTDAVTRHMSFAQNTCTQSTAQCQSFNMQLMCLQLSEIMNEETKLPVVVLSPGQGGGSFVATTMTFFQK